jgi:hypothetical protein
VERRGSSGLTFVHELIECVVVFASLERAAQGSFPVGSGDPAVAIDALDLREGVWGGVDAALGVGEHTLSARCTLCGSNRTRGSETALEAPFRVALFETETAEEERVIEGHHPWRRGEGRVNQPPEGEAEQLTCRRPCRSASQGGWEVVGRTL